MSRQSRAYEWQRLDDAYSATGCHCLLPSQTRARDLFTSRAALSPACLLDPATWPSALPPLRLRTKHRDSHTDRSSEHDSASALPYPPLYHNYCTPPARASGVVPIAVRDDGSVRDPPHHYPRPRSLYIEKLRLPFPPPLVLGSQRLEPLSAALGISPHELHPDLFIRQRRRPYVDPRHRPKPEVFADALMHHVLVWFLDIATLLSLPRNFPEATMPPGNESRYFLRISTNYRTFPKAFSFEATLSKFHIKSDYFQVRAWPLSSRVAHRPAATDREVPRKAASGSDLRWASRLRSCCRQGRRNRRQKTRGG
jgi:hypothetical protein